MIGKTISHYKILEKLGAGGMGVVYKALDTRLDRFVALKFLPPHLSQDEEGKKRFIHEAKAASALDHPNICTIYEIDETKDSQLFIAMAYYDGEHLKAKIVRGPMPVETVVNLAIQIANGLGEAHERGIVHRDVKPPNIQITRDGQVKILDFGLAKLTRQTGITQTGTTLGTVAYMSPEQSRGERVDHRTDIWALGVVLYEMLTAELPFKADYEAAMVYAIVNEDPKPLQELQLDIPANLQRAINRILAKEPENRYQTMAELVSYLHGDKQESETQMTLSTTGLTETRKRQAERRQITAMFCELTILPLKSQPLDPEVLYIVTSKYHDLCEKIINRFDGHLAQKLGNGILVYFGFPHAHEDDPIRAVHAGLGIVDGVKYMSSTLEQAQQIKLEVRAGIHTGFVVAGETDDSGEQDTRSIIGEAPTIATKMLSVVEPNTLVIGETTIRLGKGYFDTRNLGAHSLKGISESISLFEVLHVSQAKSRLDLAAETGMTPLVGREQEVALMLKRWQQTTDGMGQVVLLGGEPGIGKSRLVQMLKEHVVRDPKVWVAETQCSPYYQNTAFYPMVDLFERTIFQVKPDEPLKEKVTKLEKFLTKHGFSLPETVPIFASLLSIPLEKEYPPLNLTPDRQKQKTIEALLNVFLERAAKSPVLFVLEDLHWADPTSLELLNLIIDQVPTVQLLVVLTFRPDFQPEWTSRSHLSQITLSRLTRKSVENMVKEVAGGKNLPAEVLDQVVRKTDGVPIFVEELTKTVLESGMLREGKKGYQLTGSLTKLKIPATLQDSLNARLDRMGTAREVAQIGSILGREFSYDLLMAVTQFDEETLQRELPQLVEAELLYIRGVPPQATYIFKHALIQEAAYYSLLKSKRQEYHLKIAQVSKEQFPEIAEAKPELLAHHFTEAGHDTEAIPCWLLAGQRALQRSANMEAVAHLSRGLELVDKLPETPERIQQELPLQMAIGPALMATKGWSAPEVEKAYARAGDLCLQVEDTSQLFPVFFGLWTFHVVRAHHLTAKGFGEYLLSLAKGTKDLELLLEAHVSLGVSCFFLGELPEAKKHLEEAIKIYDPKKHGAHAFIYGQDPGMAARAYFSLTLWLLGYFDKAKRRSQESLTLAKDLDHAFSLGFAENVAAWHNQYRREGATTQKHADEAVNISREQNLVFFMAMGTILRGWALAEQGEIEVGMAEMNQGLEIYKMTGAELLMPYWLALLAETNAKARKYKRSLSLVAEALELADKTEEHFWKADLLRLKGELLQRQKAAAEKIERCYRQAIEVSKKQNAKSLELRAAVSLSRFLRKKKKPQQKKILEKLYGSFKEGLGTVDLKDAKQLIKELSKEPSQTKNSKGGETK